MSNLSSELLSSLSSQGIVIEDSPTPKDPPKELSEVQDSITIEEILGVGEFDDKED